MRLAIGHIRCPHDVLAEHRTDPRSWRQTQFTIPHDRLRIQDSLENGIRQRLHLEPGDTLDRCRQVRTRVEPDRSAVHMQAHPFASRRHPLAYHLSAADATRLGNVGLYDCWIEVGKQPVEPVQAVTVFAHCHGRPVRALLPTRVSCWVVHRKGFLQPRQPCSPKGGQQGFKLSGTVALRRVSHQVAIASDRSARIQSRRRDDYVLGKPDLESRLTA